MTQLTTALRTVKNARERIIGGKTAAVILTPLSLL